MSVLPLSEEDSGVLKFVYDLSYDFVGDIGNSLPQNLDHLDQGLVVVVLVQGIEQTSLIQDNLIRVGIQSDASETGLELECARNLLGNPPLELPVRGDVDPTNFADFRRPSELRLPSTPSEPAEGFIELLILMSSVSRNPELEVVLDRRTVRFDHDLVQLISVAITNYSRARSNSESLSEYERPD
jgi:hypothetical protein